jgi:hypothetical protein
MTNDGQNVSLHDGVTKVGRSHEFNVCSPSFCLDGVPLKTNILFVPKLSLSNRPSYEKQNHDRLHITVKSVISGNSGTKVCQIPQLSGYQNIMLYVYLSVPSNLTDNSVFAFTFNATLFYSLPAPSMTKMKYSRHCTVTPRNR